MEENLEESKPERRETEIKAQIVEKEENFEFHLNVNEENLNIELNEKESEKLLKRLFEGKPNEIALEFKKKALKSYNETKERSKKFKDTIIG